MRLAPPAVDDRARSNYNRTMMTGRIGCRVVALAAAYALVLNTLFSMAVVVKPATGTLHLVLCSLDRTQTGDRGSAPDPLGSNCIAICAALAGASDSAMDRVEISTAPFDLLPRGQSVRLAKLPVLDSATGGYRSRAPPAA